MSPTILRLLAGGLVIVAVVLAVIGWRMSQPPAPEPAPSVQAPVSPEALAPREPEERQAPRHPVVVAGRSLGVGTALPVASRPDRPDALQVVDFPGPVPNSFARPEALEGKRLTRPLAEGDILRPDHFAVGGVMAGLVPPGKRAIAVGVDEVIGGGGFVAPGDRVDVLYYVRADEGDRPQLARRLFENVRVISYGESLQGVSEEAATRRSGRTAVLALDADQSATLLLAETTGRLRLAVIGSQEHETLLARDSDAQEGVTPLRLGAAQLRPVAATRDDSPSNGVGVGQDAQPFGPAVLFRELTRLDDQQTPASRRDKAPTSSPRQVIQYVGSEVRVVELP
jgi:pilus assembly protein CpaB